ncbi:MAG: hypothetical protein AB7R55_01410 [Gemmatimonadales bacterium]
MSVFEALFEFLFKYPARVFERGVLTWTGVGYWVAPLVGVALVLTLLAYRRTRAKPVDRVVLVGLRLLALTLVGLALLRPALVLSTSVPQQNAIAVLLDDSRSMHIADAGEGATRLEAMLALAGDSTARITKRLAERFVVRTYRFSESAERLGRGTSLAGTGSRTDLASALDLVRRDAGGAPLAGIVVLTDGADNVGNSLGEPILSLEAAKIPVYTVGIGSERYERDLAIERVELPRSTLRGAVLLGSVSIRARGLGGETVTLVVEDGGRIVAQQDVTLPQSGELVSVPVRIPPLEAGPRELQVSVKPVPGELVSQDNVAHAVVRVRDRREKILYVEGTLRPEFAFMRRAAATDSNLQLVGLQRSAQAKFLRVGVDDSLELLGGFPTTRSELYRYRGLVLGSIEASAFTADQLRMIADFVGERGGGLLALGGRDSYGEGAYESSPVAEVLPVTFANRRADSAEPATPVAMALTPAGAANAALLLTQEERDNGARWDSLPELTSVNHWTGLKAGATALLTAREPEGASGPGLAVQRYGRGKALALLVQDTWLWQMHADIPLEDQSHETFWRQMLRWLLEDVPDRLETAVSPDHPAPGQRVTVRAEIGDSNFLRVNDGSAIVRVTSPLGQVDTIPLDWTLGRDGTYEGSFVPRADGIYRLEVDALVGRDTLRAEPIYTGVADRGLDFLNSEMRSPLLRRLADETGGRFYTAADVDRLPDDARYTESGVTVTEVKDLWDMPIVFFLLVLLLASEWTLRRVRGLA